jgi:hypothetical protein
MENGGLAIPPQVPCVFGRSEGGAQTIMLMHHMHVDDGTVVGTDKGTQQAVDDLRAHFDVKKQGAASLFPGVEVKRRSQGILQLISQAGCAHDILKGHGLWEAAVKPNPTAPGCMLSSVDDTELDDACKTEFKEMLGEILHPNTTTRPNLAFAVGKLNQAMARPAARYYLTANQVMQYHKGTWDYGIVCPLQDEY